MGSNCGTDHGAAFWINLEPCGLICGFMTWFLVFFAMYTTTTCIIIPWLGFGLHAWIHIITFNSLCVMSIYAHWRAMTTDPGAVPKDAKPLPSDAEEFDAEDNYDNGKARNAQKYRKFCKRCRSFKPSRAHHCSLCNRCIIKMDHHCPWVNNCIGLGNHKLFLLFIFWINIISGYALILIILKHFFCSL